MTSAEEQKLLAMGNALATVSPWQPVCVREALLACGRTVNGFALRDVTLRMWLQLEAVRSPVIRAEWSADDLLNLGPLKLALAILTGREVTSDELMLRVPPGEFQAFKDALCAHVESSFVTSLKMGPPRLSDGTPAATRKGGWGWLLPLYYRLRAIGMGRDAALDTPLAEAFALRCVAQWFDGWDPEEADYSQREAMQGLELAT